MSDKKSNPARREQQMERIAKEFANIELAITTGVQVVLEANNVSPAARLAVREYMGEVAAGLSRLGAELGEPPLIDPKSTGHATMAELFAEMKSDEAAGKRADAHQVTMGNTAEFFHRKMEEKDQGMEM